MKSSLIIFTILFFISLKIFAVPNDASSSTVNDSLKVNVNSSLFGSITTNMFSGAIITDGTGILSSIDGTTLGNVLISNGTNWSSGLVSVISNSDSLGLIGGGVISVNTAKEFQRIRVESSGGEIVMSKNPFSGGLLDGTEIVVIGNSNENTVSFQQNDNLGGCILKEAANVTLRKYYAITFIFNKNLDRYIETSRSF